MVTFCLEIDINRITAVFHGQDVTGA